MAAADKSFGTRGVVLEKRPQAIERPSTPSIWVSLFSLIRKRPLISLWCFGLALWSIIFGIHILREYSLSPEQIAARQAEAAERQEAKKKAAYEKACGPENSTLAYVMTQNVVATRLKAPSSASFPYITDVVSLPTGGCVWSIIAYVDAQNSFGAMIRTPWSAKIKHYPDEGTWQVLSVSIGG